MTHITRSSKWKCSSIYLVVAIGLTMFVASNEVSLARQKQSAVYNQCACMCDGPTGGGIIDISNTGGFGCTAYNNKTCNYEDPATGGVRTGTTKYCTGFKPGGTKAAMLAPTNPNIQPPTVSPSAPTPSRVPSRRFAPIMGRGIEGDLSNQPAPEGTTESAPTQPEPVDQSGGMKSQ